MPTISCLASAQASAMPASSPAVQLPGLSTTRAPDSLPRSGTSGRDTETPTIRSTGSPSAAATS